MLFKVRNHWLTFLTVGLPTEGDRQLGLLLGARPRWGVDVPPARPRMGRYVSLLSVFVGLSDRTQPMASAIRPRSPAVLDRGVLSPSGLYSTRRAGRYGPYPREAVLCVPFPATRTSRLIQQPTSTTHGTRPSRSGRPCRRTQRSILFLPPKSRRESRCPMVSRRLGRRLESSTRHWLAAPRSCWVSVSP